VRGLASKEVQLPPEEIDRLFAEYLEVYAAHIADRSRPFPGLEAALDALAAQGYRLAVCTNKLEWLSVRLLDTLGLSSRFVAICGQDTFTMRKPDPDMLRLTIARAGGDTGHAVMVGDSMTDVATARAAAVPVIAVDFGYTDIAPAELGADRLISHFDALPGVVTELVSIRP
jgi:phosphoglycolate phosphatase